TASQHALQRNVLLEVPAIAAATGRPGTLPVARQLHRGVTDRSCIDELPAASARFGRHGEADPVARDLSVRQRCVLVVAVQLAGERLAVLLETERDLLHLAVAALDLACPDAGHIRGGERENE